MRRPSPAILGSIALHAGVVALAFVSWPRTEPKPLPSSVPVSIVSDQIVEAGPADNPQPEPSPDNAATAPATPDPTPPQPTPPTPPAPTPPKPVPTPTPRPVPPRPQPPRPTPPRPTPPRPSPPRPQPAPPRQEPTLDLDALAGPRRPGTTQGRPAAGQQGRGTAPQAIGRASLQALAAQIRPNWNINCELPGADNLTIGVRVRLAADGRIVGSPQLTQTRSDPTWRASADSMMRALRATAPFDMPAGYDEQEVAFSFRTATMCTGR
ncbi:hypothetical protein ASG17_04350 [Brevundimonas sp. Leaf363]|uniref:TonB C-terminal domain-containing protein n=1 Tax=Brevundimonas sp. Leaf363 TaxID=1736353 RepID=UPI0006FB5810|nr:TonB C-terminal domain-containing protein [Brevundimonas sp. Leaf363]KQS55328.1 hypothetical protein ASG17_04350 [Brevundimonas sp. Leaf363]